VGNGRRLPDVARNTVARGPAFSFQCEQNLPLLDRLFCCWHRLVQRQYLFAGLDQEFALGAYYAPGWDLYSFRLVFGDLVSLDAPRELNPLRREPESP